MMDRGRSRSPRRDRRDGGNKERKTKRGPPERRVFVSNLPFDMKWQEVKDLFRKEVGEVSYVELFDDETGKSRGAGVMEFNTVELTKKAIDKMHRYEYKGRKIVVKEDFDVERDKCGRIISGSGGSSGGGGGRRDDHRGDRGSMMDRSRGGDDGHGYTYGLSPQFLDSLNITGSIHNRIFVANLDYKVDERKLKEVFRIAGKVLGVELSRDKDGKSRGFATIVYDHPVESVQAISMFNNQQLYDRKINVRFDKIPEEEPVTNLNRLPDGLRNIGMGLGQDGMPLTDVRANLPGPGDSTGNMSSMMGAGVTGNNGLMGAGAGNMGSNAGGGGVNHAALQAALTTIMGMGMGMNGNNSNNSNNSMMDNSMNSMNNSGGGMGGGSGLNNSGGGGGGGGLLGVGGLHSSSMDRMGGGGMSGGMGDMGGLGSMSGSSSGLGGGWGAGTSGMSGGMSGSMSGNMSGNMSGGMSGSMSGGRRSDSIMVRNLSMDCTWQALKDRFQHVGDIKYAEMKDRGVGVIRFGSERDAERAVSMMNGQRIDGRNVQVAFY